MDRRNKTEMHLALRKDEVLARILSDMRLGIPVVIKDNDNACVVLPVENGSLPRMKEFLAEGTTVIALTRRRADTLKARVYDEDLARIIIPDDASLDWVRAIADPSRDLQVPWKGPLETERGGKAHLHRMAIELARKARLLPAVLVRMLQGEEVEKTQLSCLEVQDFDPKQKPDVSLELVSKSTLPLSEKVPSMIYLFREKLGGDEHCAIVFGSPPRNKPVLTRLHSGCFTGDVLGSLKCDCQPQLHLALKRMINNEEGILLYINQEGRGIGLINKIRAYSLQDQGFDTVEANHRLGFEDDERDFRLGSEVLKLLGYRNARLMTNNPAKVSILESQGINVHERIPILTAVNKYNAEYMAVKARKSGHRL